MSKEKNTQQMSLWEGSHVNPSASQENKKVQTMTAISGQKCLDSLGRSNPNSLLGRMCKELLTSKTAWYSDRCKTNWKVKVSKSNVSLFQLQASVLGTKGTESGLWLTPSTTDYSQRSPDAMKKRTEWRKSIGRKTVPPGSLSEQVQYGKPITDMKMYPTPTQDSASERTKKYKQGGKPLTVAVQEEEKKKMYPTPRASAAMNENLETVKKRVERRGKLGSKLEETIATEQPIMYPTPTVVCEEGGEQSHLVERTKSGGFVSRRKGSGITYVSKLSDAMLYLEKMYPTPSTRDYKGGSGTIKEKDGKYYRQSNTTGTKYGVRLDALMEYKNKKPGGKLNPTFVEFLMGFPMNWTKTEPTESKPLETQSSHKSQGSSDSQSKKFYPTPRANEPGRTTKGYGRGLAELMEGKEQVEPKK